MTPQRAKELIPILQAIERGETVQDRTTNLEWRDIIDLRNIYECLEYRIKPKPRFREWTMDELRCLPIDALFKWSSNLGVIAGIRDNRYVVIMTKTWSNDTIEPRDLLSSWQYSTDHGSTWKRCGVEVNES